MKEKTHIFKKYDKKIIATTLATKTTQILESFTLLTLFIEFKV